MIRLRLITKFSHLLSKAHRIIEKKALCEEKENHELDYIGGKIMLQGENPMRALYNDLISLLMELITRKENITYL